jgi:hypothetical protein
VIYLTLPFIANLMKTMEPVEILAKVLAELIRRLREHRLLTNADVLALTAILKEVAERVK